MVYVTQGVGAVGSARNVTISDSIFANLRNMEQLEFTTQGSVGVTFSTNADAAFSGSVSFTAQNSGAITISASASNLVFNLTGGNNGDSFTTGSNNDSLSGGAGSDVLNASSGADTVDGGTGADSINLGVDTDIDVLIGGAVTQVGQDTITNFTADDLYKFSNVGSYTNFAPNGTAVDDLGQFGNAISYVAAQIGTGNAAGFVSFGSFYVYVNKGDAGYSASEDALIQLTSPAFDVLHSLTRNNFIA